jgi:hypothetical protein
MNRTMILCLLCSGIFCALALAQTSAPPALTDAKSAELDAAINTVRNLAVHRLDHKLPRVTLADWLQAQAGPDVRMNWAFRYDPEAGSTGWEGPPDMVEADMALNDGQSVVVEIAVAHCNRQVEGCHRRVPSVFLINVITGRDATTGRLVSSELDRLSDLPRFLQRLRGASNEDKND